MTEEMMNNGATCNGGDRMVEIAGHEDHEEAFVDFDDGDTRASGLMQNVVTVLEQQEKRDLIRENRGIKERIEKLKSEIQRLEGEKAELKREVERSKADKKVLESVAARAADLETEVSRLQHDLITSMAEEEEANKELSELKKVVEGLKISILEKDVKLEDFEKETNLLLEKFDKEVEGMKEARAAGESRARELEKKLEALEGREGVEKSEKIRAEQEANAKIDKKEVEIRKLKKWAEELESVVVMNGVEMEKMKKERDELEIVNKDLEALLKKTGTSEQMIGGLKDKAVVMDGDVKEGWEKRLMGLKLEWPVVAASTGAIVAVAVLYYLRCARQR